MTVCVPDLEVYMTVCGPDLDVETVLHMSAPFETS